MGYFWEGGVTIDTPINDYLHFTRQAACKDNKLIAQGIALGIWLWVISPCKGRSIDSCQSFCPYRALAPPKIPPRVLPWASSSLPLQGAYQLIPDMHSLIYEGGSKSRPHQTTAPNQCVGFAQLRARNVIGISNIPNICGQLKIKIEKACVHFGHKLIKGNIQQRPLTNIAICDVCFVHRETS